MVFKALLIDFDNTLVVFNEDTFLLEYARLAAPYFADVLDESTFFQKLLASTKHMLSNHGKMTNAEAFSHHFDASIPELSFEDVNNRFNRFYQEAFQQLQRVIKPVPKARGLLEHALDSGLQVAIATNPIFPKVGSQARLEWANISDLNLSLVTHAENMSYSKPHPEYFLTILKMLGRKGEECLMAGNDRINDMSASAVGIETFLVELDEEKGRIGLISQELGRSAKDSFDPSRFRIDAQGTLEELERYLFNR